MFLYTAGGDDESDEDDDDEDDEDDEGEDAGADLQMLYQDLVSAPLSSPRPSFTWHLLSFLAQNLSISFCLFVLCINRSFLLLTQPSF